MRCKLSEGGRKTTVPGRETKAYKPIRSFLESKLKKLQWLHASIYKGKMDKTEAIVQLKSAPLDSVRVLCKMARRPHTT
jgi:hypothetical protein